MRWMVVSLLALALVVLFFVLSPTRKPHGAPADPGAGEEGDHGVEEPLPAKKGRKPDSASVGGPESPDATLEVVVTDRAGRACVGALVRAGFLADGVGRSGPEVPADAEGRVALEVEADKTRSVTARIGCLSRWMPVTPAKGGRSEVRIVMPTGGRIVGEIRHPVSGPLEGVVLTTSLTADDRTQYFARAETDAEGRFVIDPVPAGTYKIRIYARQCHHSLQDYVAVRHDGAETVDVGIILVGGAVLQGTVRDATDSSPLPGVTVTLSDPVRATTTTDADGRYAFRDLTACAYDLSFRKPGFGQRYMRDVEIRADRLDETLDVTLVRGEVVDVFVRDTEDRPVAGPVQLRFSQTGGGASSSGLVELDDRGHGRFAGPAPGCYQLDVRRSGLECLPRTVDIVPGRNTVRITVQRRAYTWGKGIRSLHGTVRDSATGLPIPGARIHGPRGEAFTDAGGEYVLHDLGAGKHRLFLTKDGYGDLRATGVVSRDDEERQQDLALDPAATLRLNLRDQEGRPVPGEVNLIYVRRVDGKKTGGGSSSQADDKGRVVFRRLLPGRCKLIVSVPGIGAKEVVIVIKDGENMLDLVLEE